ncbi:response regulator [Nocardia colli]|uniref:Response regulator n=1 Tax=Nocardia colli TaxID=2545717 RepID=A0A5N0EB27_9NOCA|nr:response regulator [Nocardia colli]KAA8885679.1 response regulator [Nocardia colli]
MSARPVDILLVEDDPGDELMTREAFEEHNIGSTLHVARDGQEALDFLFRQGDHLNAPRPDLVLLDLNLPKYNGRQILAKIRADDELSDMPVVILSTSSAEDDVLSSYRLFANAYVTKPADLDQYTSAIKQIDEFFAHLARLPRRK